MIPHSFDYASPKTLQEAISMLEAGGDGAKVLAGGQSLIPLLKLRLASPTLLVDINRVEGLDYIREADGQLRIGALTRMAKVERSALLMERYQVLCEAAGVVGDPLVRNLGTMGGNLTHGDPSNDMPAVMLALDAEFAATGPSGERTIRAEDYFLDTFTVALKHEEILTEVRIPTPPPESGGSYVKLEQKVADFATAAVAAQIAVDSKGEFSRVGLGLTAVGPTAIKAKEAEEALKWRKISDKEALRTAVRLALKRAEPATDIRGTAEYKKRVIAVLLTRAIDGAVRRASRGGQ